MELGIMEGTVAAAMVRFAFEAGMDIGGGGDISDALFDAEDNLAENFGEIDESTAEGKFWAEMLELTEQYIVDECKKIIMDKSEPSEEQRINDILSSAITNGKYEMELLVSELRECCDSIEELGDSAYDIGVAIRKLVVEMQNSDTEERE